MSIVVSVKVYDGVVLGADSQAQINISDAAGNVGIAQVYSNARKLFQLRELPIGIGTYGTGNIGKRSIESLLFEFNKRPTQTEGHSVEEAVTKLLEFLQGRHGTEFKSISEEKRPVLGVLAAGYSDGEPIPEEWEFLIPNDSAPRRIRDKDSFGASWRGTFLPFTRLFLGLDPRIRETLQELGVSQDILSKIGSGRQMPVIFDHMPLQDAVDFAEFVLNVTINVARFEVGTATCGGALDLAVIKPDVGFKWVRQKPLEILTSRDAKEESDV